MLVNDPRDKWFFLHQLLEYERGQKRGKGFDKELEQDVMMPVFQLSEKVVFPPVGLAQPDGLLAVGGDLSSHRLITAYSMGIFPWYTEGEPILWWSPAPRLVLFPDEFHLPRRLARTIRQQKFQVTADRAFRDVISQCGAIRTTKGLPTWITADMKAAYVDLFQRGYAHSVECWDGDVLVGGLYGVCLDRMFFGESMFAWRRDASKIAFAALIGLVRHYGIELIDCQMTTEHLLRFGARELSREDFQRELIRTIEVITPQPLWQLRGIWAEQGRVIVRV